MDAGWLIMAAGAAGVLAGGVIVTALYRPLRFRVIEWQDAAERFENKLGATESALRSKQAESARYAAAIARIITSLASAKPDTTQPFYPHRLAAFREAVALVLDACREAA